MSASEEIMLSSSSTAHVTALPTFILPTVFEAEAASKVSNSNEGSCSVVKVFVSPYSVSTSSDSPTTLNSYVVSGTKPVKSSSNS